MHRHIAVGLTTLFTMGLLSGGGVATAVAAPAKAPSKTYTVTRLIGPYNGEAHWSNNLPGQVPDNEAPTLACAPGESILSGSAKINRKTSHGTAKRDVLTLDPIGVFWDSEDDSIKWGVWVKPTGKSGWNSVTMTVVCRKRT